METKIEREIKFIATYSRVSTSAQEVQETIQNQINSLKEYAKKNNWEIIHEYKDEGWSGDVLKRPGLDQLRIDAKRKVWDAVLIYDPDRLARRYSYQELVMDELKEAGVQVLFVTVGTPQNSEDKILYGVRGLFAEYERTKIAERFRLGKVSRVKNGHILTTEAPYGYTYILNQGKKGDANYIPGHLEINEDEAKVVREIFSWVADKGLTVRGVVKKLQKLGIQPRKSKRGVWSTSSLSTMLRRETYIGTAYWRRSEAIIPAHPLKDEKYKKVKKTSRRLRSKEEWVPITGIPKIIDEDLFNRAGERLKSNFATLGRNRKYEYLLSGKVRCGCGCTRTGSATQKGKHLYYCCSNRVHSFPLPPTCSDRAVNAKITDRELWHRAKLLLTSPDLILRQVEIWNAKCKNIKSGAGLLDIKDLQNKIDKLKAEEGRIVDLYSKEMISLEMFKEKVKPIREKIKGYEGQIIKAKLEKNSKEDLSVVVSEKDIKTFTEGIKSKLNNLSFTAKQDIVRRITNEVTISHNSLQAYGCFNLKEIYDALCSKYRNCGATQRWEIDLV